MTYCDVLDGQRFAQRTSIERKEVVESLEGISSRLPHHNGLQQQHLGHHNRTRTVSAPRPSACNFVLEQVPNVRSQTEGLKVPR